MLGQQVKKQHAQRKTRHRSKLNSQAVVRLERLRDGLDTRKNFVKPKSVTKKDLSVISGRSAANSQRGERSGNYTRDKSFLRRPGHSKQSPYQCNGCDKKFSYDFELNSHVKICSGENSYRCRLCDKSFTEQSGLDWHMHWHTTADALLIQKKVMNEQRRLKKDSYMLEMQQRKTSREIIKTSKPPTPVAKPCVLCGKLLMPGSLHRHMQAHTGIRPYVCDKCGRGFVCKEDMKKHRKVVHSTDRPYQCHLCEKNYKELTSLKNHISWHEGTRVREAKYKCKLCDKCYKDCDSLRYHMTAHTGEKGFLCNICGKSFRWRGIYNLHMKKHWGVKAFKCAICDYRGATKRCLESHMETHQEMPFKCDTCLRGFRSHKMYQKHLDNQPSNCGNPQFSCSLCNKSFFKLCNLRAHERRFHRKYIRKPSQVQAQKHTSLFSSFEIPVQPPVNSSSNTIATISDIPYSDALKESLCAPPPLHNIQFSYDPPSNAHMLTGPL